MKNKEEALQHFEEAYLIYETQFGGTALKTGNAAMQIATILEEQQGKLKDAYEYVQIATLAFQANFEMEPTIFAQFLAVSISYSLKHKDSREQCRHLWELLVKRDQQLMAVEGGQTSSDDQLEDRINKIKELCVATFILEITRTLSPSDK